MIITIYGRVRVRRIMEVLTTWPEAALARRHPSQADSAGGTSIGRHIDNVDSGSEHISKERLNLFLCAKMLP